MQFHVIKSRIIIAIFTATNRSYLLAPFVTCRWTVSNWRELYRLQMALVASGSSISLYTSLANLLLLTRTGMSNGKLDSQDKTFQSELVRMQSLSDEAKEIVMTVSGLNKVMVTTSVRSSSYLYVKHVHISRRGS